MAFGWRFAGGPRPLQSKMQRRLSRWALEMGHWEQGRKTQDTADTHSGHTQLERTAHSTGTHQHTCTELKTRKIPTEYLNTYLGTHPHTRARARHTSTSGDSRPSGLERSCHTRALELHVDIASAAPPSAYPYSTLLGYLGTYHSATARSSSLHASQGTRSEDPSNLGRKASSDLIGNSIPRV